MARSLALISAPLTRATTGSSVCCAQAVPVMATDASAVASSSMRAEAGSATRRRDERELIKTGPCDGLGPRPGVGRTLAQSADNGNGRLVPAPNEGVNAAAAAPAARLRHL